MEHLYNQRKQRNSGQKPPSVPRHAPPNAPAATAAPPHPSWTQPLCVDCRHQVGMWDPGEPACQAPQLGRNPVTGHQLMSRCGAERGFSMPLPFRSDQLGRGVCGPQGAWFLPKPTATPTHSPEEPTE